MQRLSMIVSSALAAWLSACSSDPAMSPPKQRLAPKSDQLLTAPKTQEAVAAAATEEGADATATSSLDESGTSADGVVASDEGQPVVSDDGPIASGTVLADGGSASAISEILTDCGFVGGVLPDPNQTLFQKVMRSQPVTITGSKAVTASMLGLPVIPFLPPPPIPPATYTAVVRATVDVSASMATMNQRLNVALESFGAKIIGFSVPPGMGRADAEREVQANNAVTLASGPSSEERSKMSSSGAWKGIFCSVNPTKTLTVTSNGTSKTITFDPPIPGAIWSKASPTRFKEEIGASRTFANITATVTSSTDSTMPTGSTFKGSVTVAQISGSLSEIGVQADIAYAIRSDFGGNTVRLGLNPTQSFYVTSNNKDLQAIVVETGVAQLPRLVLSGQ